VKSAGELLASRIPKFVWDKENVKTAWPIGSPAGMRKLNGSYRLRPGPNVEDGASVSEVPNEQGGVAHVSASETFENTNGSVTLSGPPRRLPVRLKKPKSESPENGVFALNTSCPSVIDSARAGAGNKKRAATTTLAADAFLTTDQPFLTTATPSMTQGESMPLVQRERQYTNSNEMRNLLGDFQVSGFDHLIEDTATTD
jgi:hypothetical protein